MISMIKMIFYSIFVAIVVASVAPDKKLGVTASRFYVSTSRVSFVAAEIECKTLGLELASIETEEEQELVVNATKEAEYHDSDGYWIGGAADASDSWYWISTGLRMAYTNWGVNQPIFYPAPHAWCVRLGNFYKTDEPTAWANIDCNSMRQFICEFPEEGR